MVFVLLVLQNYLKIINEAPIIDFIRKDKPRKAQNFEFFKKYGFS